MNDLYNMNETGLFWKVMLNRILITLLIFEFGVSMNKARIIINLYYNVFNFHKFKSWFIERVKNSRVFDTHDVNVDNLRMIWRANSFVWMIKKIFDE